MCSQGGKNVEMDDPLPADIAVSGTPIYRSTQGYIYWSGGLGVPSSLQVEDSRYRVFFKNTAKRNMQDPAYFNVIKCSLNV